MILDKLGQNVSFNPKSQAGAALVTREAGVSIKPGVSAAKPQEPAVENIRSPRSGRQRNHFELHFVIATTIGRFAGSASFWVDDPGVPLRFTPGFMLTAASRAKPTIRMSCFSILIY